MYPARALSELATRKAEIRRAISGHRAQLAAAAAAVARPVAWIDRAVAFGRRWASLGMVAAVPVALFSRRAQSPWVRAAGVLMRLGPLVLGAYRGFQALARDRTGRAG
jgi:hypothetical protein